MTSNTPGTSTDTDAVADAARAIPAEAYLGSDGLAVQPVIPPHATQRHLRALDLHPGMRVLEIGTGSGYSAALMGQIVGQSGHVLTIDNDEDLSKRAGALFSKHGHRAIAAVGNGLLGHPGRAPYDRIFVGATPAAIPAAWLDQLAEGGVLVTGCLVSDLPGSYAVAHIAKTADGLYVTVHAGRYPPMSARATPSTITVTTGHDNSRYYLATSYPGRGTAERFLGLLRAKHAEPWPTAPGEFLDLKNWLLARRPAGLFTARTELGEGIGLAMQFQGTPEVAMVTASGFLARPARSPMAARLADLMADWRNEGYTTTDELDAVLLRSGGSYRVRLDD
jgi:protein-L-isoaspartate(D-aspartate) O-methyltransferase